ncbi:MAG TPA: FtsH protease activity modulator HflK [Gammaproteobacteria bacterium]|nr:FtsH protease activity modulator HflK [Gammaproteobacteria bacterium]
MPWNPSDQNKDPWGRDKNKPQGGPPDLDAVFRQFKNKLMTAFGGKKGGAAGGSGTPVSVNGVPVFFSILIIIALLIVWGLSGIYIVSPADRAVVLRFGEYVRTVGPGPHWIPRFIESEKMVNVQRVSNFTYTSEMLTKDENIVSVTVTVPYRIVDAKNYLFNVVDPDASLEQATASALRQVVGHSTLDQLLTTGRQQIRDQVATQLRQIVESYHSGLLVTDVTLQPIKPPEPVTDAFDDVIKAREDQQSYINKADAYAKQVAAVADGQIARIMQEADAYQKEVVSGSKAATAGFLALLPEYQKNPTVTEARLYLSAMETILTKASKVFVDQKGSNQMFYLPLDKIMATTSQSSPPTAAATPEDNTQQQLAEMSSAIAAAGGNSATGRSGYPVRGGN